MVTYLSASVRKNCLIVACREPVLYINIVLS